MKPAPTATDASEVLSFSPMSLEKLTLRQVFEAEESPLLHFAYGILGRREVAEDVVQDAFLRLHSNWEQIRSPKAWLYRSVRNLSLNYLRDHKRETVTDETDEWSVEKDPREALARMEAAGAVQLLVAELPESEATLIRLKYHEGLRYEQISERTGLSVGNVGYKLHHLLKGLSASLRRMGVESAEG